MRSVTVPNGLIQRLRSFVDEDADTPKHKKGNIFYRFLWVGESGYWKNAGSSIEENEAWTFLKRDMRSMSGKAHQGVLISAMAGDKPLKVYGDVRELERQTEGIFVGEVR